MIKPAEVCFVAVILLNILFSSAQAGWNPEKQQKRIKDSERTVAAFSKKDPELQAFFDKAYGYAVFPTVGKGGFFVGAAHGNGVVYQQGKVVGFSTLSQVTIGLQFGGQAYSEIIFFKDKKAFNQFTKGDFAFSGQASAVAANKGVAANIDYSSGVAVFTLAKGGLMYEASIGGQKFSFTSLQKSKS